MENKTKQNKKDGEENSGIGRMNWSDHDGDQHINVGDRKGQEKIFLEKAAP